MFFHRFQKYNNFPEQLHFLWALKQVVSYLGTLFFLLFVLVKKSSRGLVYMHVKDLFALAESICTEAAPSPHSSLFPLLSGHVFADSGTLRKPLNWVLFFMCWIFVWTLANCMLSMFIVMGDVQNLSAATGYVINTRGGTSPEVPVLLMNWRKVVWSKD